MATTNCITLSRELYLSLNYKHDDMASIFQEGPMVLDSLMVQFEVVIKPLIHVLKKGLKNKLCLVQCVLHNVPECSEKPRL